MKRILGLDLGTTSIGWALVNEAETENDKSSIIKTGVRVIPYGDNLKKKNPKTGKLSDIKNIEEDFNSGQGISPNAGRTQKRGARRNLQRFKQRRAHLITLLKENSIINDETALTESGKNSTHNIWELRAKAAIEQISLEDFARVLLAINKKRGYKSNRKAKDEADGQAIDGMEIAKLLYNEKLTPGRFVFQRLKEDKKKVPDFYRSDLQNEFDKVWNKQKAFYPEILTPELKENIEGKNRKAVWAICEKPFGIVGVKRKGNNAEQKAENYKWRVQGLDEKLDLEQLAIVFQEINGQINSSSGYLGAISDRSKELYFNDQTVGQYLYKQILNNPHIPLKNQVFYRQDYLYEFIRIWEVQSQNRKNVLTDDLKADIKDTVIFYQRRLKSQKGLISVCELEGREIEIEKDGKKKKKIIGPKAIPNSSPLFQEFKIWQILNNLKFENTETREVYSISELDKDLETRNQMFNELNVKGKLSANEVLKVSVENHKTWEAKNFKEIEGNNTNAALINAYKHIVDLSGHDASKSKPVERITDVFELLGINTDILYFNSDLEGKEFEQQPSYQLWHLLYSYEGDDSESGNEKLYELLEQKFGFDNEYAKVLAGITLQDDYGSLSAKAIKKILPFLKAGHEYSEACELAGYRHSHFVTKEENEKRILNDKLEILQKNSLRNPVVEKILNQMVNVINVIIDYYGKPDEIRIELARELKKSAKERAEMTSNINKATTEHVKIRQELEKLHPFNTGVRITRNDIIKYKLYQELAPLGYHTIYTNTYVPVEKLFTKEFDIEHIIPKAVLFDDSFSNKTLAIRDFNRIKSNKTGVDAVAEKYSEGSVEFNRYIDNVEKLYGKGKGVISKAKYNKLLMNGTQIPDGFIERDLRNSQYIARKAQEMLKKVFRTVIPTTGSVTDKLREDWQLINVLQELNWEKYDKLGLTYYETSKDRKQIPVIKDWTKRNDHRHHAMDALTVAFTKHSHIQYFNYLNARRDENHKNHSNIFAIEQKETFINDKDKRLVKPPIPIEQFRAEAKKHLENTLVSFKAKNKVITRNINRARKKSGETKKVTLTPRGQLHKETVYGSSKVYITKSEKVGTKFDYETIQLVAKKSHREVLLKRLQDNNNDPKRAFSGKNALSKNPIYLDEHQFIKLPEKVKLVWLDNRYTIRKDISPDLKIEKVVDKEVKKILKNRLIEFNNDAKAAFSNLDETPIWLNKEKGIKLKRITITGVSNAEALHTKKDHFGNEILDVNDKPIPVDYVSTGNNHHVAIYKDEKGNLQENVVSFYDAVARVNAGTTIVWHNHPDNPEWEFLFTMKQNEYFVFPAVDFNPNDIDLLNPENTALISPNLFRVQKLGSKDYWFRHHLETTLNGNLKDVLYKRVQNNNSLKGCVKVRINHIGQIVKVGE